MPEEAVVGDNQAEAGGGAGPGGHALWLRGGIVAVAVLLVGAGSALAVVTTDHGAPAKKSQTLVSIPPVAGAAAPVTVPTAPTTTVSPATVPTTVAPSTTHAVPTTKAPSTTSGTNGVVAGAVAAVCGGGVDVAGAPAGRAVSSTVSLEGVTATFSAVTTGTSGGDPVVTSPKLTVSKNGDALLSSAVAPPSGMSEFMPWSLGTASAPPFSQGRQMTPLCAALFPGQSFPTVLLGMTAGGAHCCTTLRAYQVQASGVAAPVDTDLGDPTGTLTPSGGRAFIATVDDAFAYAFTDFAASGAPFKALVFQGGRFVDVTRQHLDLVASDATTQWGYYEKSKGDPLGFLAAWAADETLLGKGTGALATIQQLQSSGELPDSATGTKASQFASDLKAFLSKYGYS